MAVSLLSDCCDRQEASLLRAAAVVAGMSVSVNTVLSQLEREPGEFIVDPWVSERATFVAEQRGGSLLLLICCVTERTIRSATGTATSERSVGFSTGRRPLIGRTRLRLGTL